MSPGHRTVRLARLIVLAALVPLVAACATPARVGEMSVSAVPAEVSQGIDTSPLKGSVVVGTVTGGKETNPLWTSQVGDYEFRQALTMTLNAAGMLSQDGKGPYRLNATLRRLDQPLMGLDMSVLAQVDYTLEQTESRSMVFSTTISEAYTAKFGDAFVGVERLRLANEGAIKVNLQKMLGQLVQGVQKPASRTDATGKPVS